MLLKRATAGNCVGVSSRDVTAPEVPWPRRHPVRVLPLCRWLRPHRPTQVVPETLVGSQENSRGLIGELWSSRLIDWQTYARHRGL